MVKDDKSCGESRDILPTAMTQYLTILSKKLRRVILSKTWYENMDFDDLAGIHVRAKLYNGTLIEGKLHKWNDHAYALDDRCVLTQDEVEIFKAPCIEYVDYI